MKHFYHWCLTIATALLSITSCVQKSTANNKANEQTMNNDKVLVAYFSATGTTKRVAQRIAKATNGELLAIEPEMPYSSADLDWTVSSSRSSRENADASSRPAFKHTKNNLNNYTIIYLGFPIWWDVCPRVVNTFIEAYHLDGKKVMPFATSGGTTIDYSMKELKLLYPNIHWLTGALLNSPSDKAIEAFIAQ